MRGALVRIGVTLATSVAAVGGGFAAVVAAPADASGPVTPHVGCWGTCGGDFGPSPVTLFVGAHNTLDSFGIVESCLGTHLAQGPIDKVRVDNGVYWGALGEIGRTTLPIRKGRVSYSGRARLQTSDSGVSHATVAITLSITFTSATRSRGTLTARHGHCRPFHFTAREL